MATWNLEGGKFPPENPAEIHIEASVQAAFGIAVSTSLTQ